MSDKKFDYFTFLISAIIFAIAFFLCRSCWNTYGVSTIYKYNVCVEYQYENEDKIRIINYEDQVSFNNSVKSVKPVYTVSPGYNEKVVIVSYYILNNNENNQCHRKNIEIINCRDYKAKVINITYKKIN